MLFKLSSLYTHTHHEDDCADEIENCSLCELAIENQNSDAVLATVFVFRAVKVYINTSELLTSYNVVLSSISIHSSLFGRPPPLMV